MKIINELIKEHNKTKEDIISANLKITENTTQIIESKDRETILKDRVDRVENKLDDTNNKPIEDYLINDYSISLPFTDSYVNYSDTYDSYIRCKNGEIHVNTTFKKNDTTTNNYITNQLPYEITPINSNAIASVTYDSTWTTIQPIILTLVNGKLAIESYNFNIIGGQDKTKIAYVPINALIDLRRKEGWKPNNLTTAIDNVNNKDNVSKMALMSDLHFKTDVNYKKKLNLFNNMIANSGCIAGIVLGDNVNESAVSNNKSKLIENIRTLRRCLPENVLFVGGNHDTNSYASTATKNTVLMPWELYDGYMRGKTGFEVDDEGTRRLN